MNHHQPTARLVIRAVTGTMAIAVALGVAVTTPNAAAGPSETAPPKALHTIEEQAEDIIDRVPGRSWARITRDVATVKATWARYERRARADGVAATHIDAFNRALTRLAAAAKDKDGPGTSQAANDLSGATVELFANYKLDDPVEVGRLDVIGRQIELDVDTNRLDDVPNQIDRARVEWEAIRADVSARSAAVPSQVDATMAALGEGERAHNTGLLHAEIRVLLEIVDAMEALYG